MDETAARLLDTFAKAPKDSPSRQDWPRLYEFIIYVHRHRLSASINDVTLHLLDNGFTMEEARRVVLVFIHGTELLLQYDRDVMA
jgi:hypothetical protein